MTESITYNSRQYRDVNAGRASPRIAPPVPPKKRSKYGNQAVVVDGVRFASKAEARRDGELKLLERADKIHGIRRQPKFDLYVNGRKICRYIGDWSYRDGPLREHNAQLVVEDRKGHVTPAFKIKWALAKALHPEIEWRLS